MLQLVPWGVVRRQLLLVSKGAKVRRISLPFLLLFPMALLGEDVDNALT